MFEEGYIRPHWITLEQGGVNGHSSFPKQADIIHALADKAVLEAPEPVGGGLWQRIFYDFVYNFMNLLMIWKFPHHRTHRPYTVWAEYATWTKRLVTLSWLKPRAEKAVREIADMAAPCYLFPLQLDSDSQVRVHSPYGTMPDAIRTVLKTFASEAPKDAVLIIKNHPLDNGMINYGKLIRAFAAEQAIKDRVRFIDGGDLNALLAHCRGVITINSTVGMTALDKKVPVLLLGDAIYNIPGLVYRSGQTEFWTDPKSPDLSLLDALRTSLLGYCHANGNFYTRTGMELAVTHSLPRLTQPTGL
ncbi:hypothetical protein GCM10007924_09990 [Sneathiella chinensis]|uniref:Capsular biosynthesis protein n=1 Tax=Sneathiella chinensis TaxID=349750 RepID=A0ABQ5U3G7_9PROT|nr:hypothetical protein GCM10007924_09990 [Sneathiella chinensis]